MESQFHFLALWYIINSKEAYEITWPYGPHHFKFGMSRIFNGWIWRGLSVATPHLEECEDDTHTPEMGTWESSGTLKTLEFNYRGQNTLPWRVLHVIEKLLKCRCRKWPCMSHLDICSISLGKKKGRESNWQFDSWPLKVENWPNPGVCRWRAAHR
jgi:hypothetical protein